MKINKQKQLKIRYESKAEYKKQENKIKENTIIIMYIFNCTYLLYTYIHTYIHIIFLLLFLFLFLFLFNLYYLICIYFYYVLVGLPIPYFYLFFKCKNLLSNLVMCVIFVLVDIRIKYQKRFMKKWIQSPHKTASETINNSQKYTPSLVRPNLNSCIQIRKDQISELKDYTFYENNNYELDPTWDIDSELSCDLFESTLNKKQSEAQPRMQLAMVRQKSPTISQISIPCIQQIESIEIMQDQDKQIGRSHRDREKMDEEKGEKQWEKNKGIEQDNDQQQSRLQKKTKPIRRERRQNETSRLSNTQKKRQKAETKNIPKNYGKVLIRYVQESRNLVERIMNQYPCAITYEDLCETLENMKNNVRTKDQLLGLWRHEIYGQVMRIVSDHFFRKKAYDYIFNSRVEDLRSVLKYKPRLQQFVADPGKQENLKYK